jgi:ferredoxin, 2Fe-2S
MITLIGRRVKKTVEPVTGFTILDMALKHDVDWGFSCTRGTCCRCRCQVAEGMDHLSSLTDEELDALEPEEIEQGFRLGCQTKIKTEGNVTVTNKPYF